MIHEYVLYILGRFLQMTVSLFVLITIVFFTTHLSGDPVRLLLSINATREQEENLRAYYGLDKPLYAQYVKYLWNLSRGDLGRSMTTDRRVAELIGQRISASFQLVGSAMVVAVAIALPIGVYSAVRRGRRFDRLGMSLAVLGQSIPVFWMGLMLMLVFSVWLGLLPTSGRGGLRHVLLPAFVLGYSVAAGILRLTRSSMLEVLGQDYVKLARAKGLSETTVIWKHAFRNAMLPVVTYFAILCATLVAGTIVTETVFAWPGLGQLVIDGVTRRDIPLIQGLVLFIGSVVLMTNLIVDILYSHLDPKITYTQ